MFQQPFCMSQKAEKPTLTGHRIKTRKRGMKLDCFGVLGLQFVFVSSGYTSFENLMYLLDTIRNCTRLYRAKDISKYHVRDILSSSYSFE